MWSRICYLTSLSLSFCLIKYWYLPCRAFVESRATNENLMWNIKHSAGCMLLSQVADVHLKQGKVKGRELQRHTGMPLRSPGREWSLASATTGSKELKTKDRSQDACGDHSHESQAGGTHPSHPNGPGGQVDDKGAQGPSGNDRDVVCHGWVVVSWCLPHQSHRPVHGKCVGFILS